ncbi:unnamed protein product [Urochloa humidicola]
MSLDTKSLLVEIDKLFAKQNAKWDQWFAARDAKWDQRFSSRKGTLPVQISTEQPVLAPATTTSPPTTFPDAAAAAASFVAPPEGAVARREVPLASQVVPTAAGMAEILDIEPTDEISNSFIDFEPSDEIRSDGCLTPAVVEPTESVAVFPIAACVAPAPASCLTSNHPAVPACSVPANQHPPYATTAVQGTTKVILNNSPPRCLKVCHNHEITMLKPISVALTSISAPVTSATSVDSSLGTDQQSSKASDDPLATFDGSMQVLRYFSIYDHADPNGVVVPCHFTPVHCGHVVFEKWSDQFAALPSLVIVVYTVP